MTFETINACLKKFTVGIAGAGGLGSNCAAALVRSGIGKLIIADFDTVSESNLNRQFYFFDQIGDAKVIALKDNLLRINPDIQIIVHNLKLNNTNSLEIFKNCDIVVEAFDLAEQKEMLIEALLTFFPEKLVVAGLGMAGYGDSNSLKVRKVDNLYICGDELSEISENNPPLAPRVGIVANMQANVVLDLLLNKFVNL
jgi:sulfur carrier protein ThiS adenylyltransferase